MKVSTILIFFFYGWQPPVPIDPWRKVLHAYEEGSVCPQWDYLSLAYMGREDCLFLNVFTREVSHISIE